jgi:hypothetical protein
LSTRLAEVTFMFLGVSASLLRSVCRLVCQGDSSNIRERGAKRPDALQRNMIQGDSFGRDHELIIINDAIMYRWKRNSASPYLGTWVHDWVIEYTEIWLLFACRHTPTRRSVFANFAGTHENAVYIFHIPDTSDTSRTFNPLKHKYLEIRNIPDLYYVTWNALQFHYKSGRRCLGK